MERLRVRLPAGPAGEFSSPKLTVCVDSYSVSVPPPCYRNGTLKTPVILPKVQVAGYTLTRIHVDPTKSEWADYAAVQAWCENLFGKRAHTQLVREQSATVVLAR